MKYLSYVKLDPDSIIKIIIYKIYKMYIRVYKSIYIRYIRCIRYVYLTVSEWPKRTWNCVASG